MDDIDYVVFYDKPLLTFERLIETYLATVPRGFASFRHGDPGVDQGKDVSEATSPKGAGDIAGTKSWKGRCCSPSITGHAASAFSPPHSRALPYSRWTALANGARPRSGTGRGKQAAG